MSDAASGKNPPKPRFALSIGVVGHKPDRIAKDPETLAKRKAAIRAKVDEVLAAIARIAEAVRKRHQDVFSPPGPEAPAPLCVVSALAEGSDTIVAQAALGRSEKDFALDAPLPFSVDVYEQDFTTEQARADFKALREGARAMLELPGERNDGSADGRRKENRAYEAAGLTVLSQAYILLAVWDAGPSRGRGGTTDMLNAAARAGIPVIHVDVEGTAATLRWSGLDPYPVPVAFIEDVVPKPLDDGVLGKLIDTLVRPPSRASEREALEHYFGEKQRRLNLRLEFPLLTLLSCVRCPQTVDVLPDLPSTLADRLADFAAPAGSDMNDIAGAYGWSDAVGVHFAQRFRSSFVLNFVFAASAVLLAVISLLFHEWKPWFVLAELILIGLVVRNTYRGQKRRLHRRWVEARELAERLRAATMLWALGVRPASVASVEATWTGWYARAILRQQGMRTGVLDRAAGLAAARGLMDRLLRDQYRYHGRNAFRMERLEHRLELAGSVLSGITVAGALLYLAMALIFSLANIHLAPERDQFVTYTVTILAAGLPALATASYGIRVIGDFEGIARRSRRTRSALRRVIRALRQDPLDLAIFRMRANEASDAMLGDVASWRLSAESRGLAIPG